MKFLIRLLIIFCFLVGNKPATGQYGFNKPFSFEGSSGLDFDDIIYDNDHIVIRGNIHVDTLGLWGLFVCQMDTFGQIMWHHIFTDRLGTSDLISNTPTRFIKTNDDGYLLPVNYFNRGTIGLYKLNSYGEFEFSVEYENNENAIVPNYLAETENNFYISGYQQRADSGIDVFLLKTDLSGNKIWLNHFGIDTLNEYSAGLTLNANHSISLGCQIRPPDYQDLPYEMQWRQPWLVTIDTTGKILKEWKGSRNDPKVKAMFGLSYNQSQEWGLIYSEYEKIFTGIQYEIFAAPSISVLDSAFNLKWKNSFGSFTSSANSYFDLTYDSLRKEWITVGQLADHSRLVGCVVKYDDDGNIIWSVLDTAFYNPMILANHYLGSVAVSPSGSVYAAGKIDYTSPPYYEYGWILKITADGCIDTLCTTTAIEEIIRQRPQKLSVYPNPTREEIHITLDDPNSMDVSISIFNLMGERVFEGILEDHKKTIEVSRWPAGIYLVRAMSNGIIVASSRFVH